MKTLLKMYREMADSGVQFRGLSLLNNADQVGKFIRRLHAQTVLDYGTGAGDAYRSPHKIYKTWGLPISSITLYDPSFKRHEKKPDRRFDVVVCSDVLEHITEDEVPRFIADLFNHAKLGVWASVCCRPAKKVFPGTDINLHCTIKPMEWWREQFAAAQALFTGLDLQWELVETP